MRFSLRTRVLAATLLLVALGLTVAGIATYELLHKQLIDRLDQQLQAAAHPVGDIVAGEQHPGGPGPFSAPDSIPPGTYGAFLDPSGTVIRSQSFTYDETETPPVPNLPPGLPGSTTGGLDPPSTTFTAEAIPSSASPFRVLAVAVELGLDHQQATQIVAFPLTEVNATLHRLVLVEVGVAASVLVAIGLLSWWLVRLGLRPLDRMAVTAGSIAAGDLSKRVEPADDHTEVGKLGTALNTMLGQIETSFEEQRASEARLRRFVADASHELRTPLTSIRGYAELFRRGAADRPEDLERAMRRIEDEGARMGLLVDDLLLLARLDQGRPLERHPVDLTAMAGDAADDLRAADPDRTVRLDAKPGVVIEGDEPRLRQVVANLLDNARTHTPAGTEVGIRLSVDGSNAVLEVTDKGPGMPPDEQERVFERFYRGDPSRSRASGGTGLGLSIAAAIVRAHDGTIGVSTSPGQGATFRITLPLTAAPRPSAESKPEPADSEPDAETEAGTQPAQDAPQQARSEAEPQPERA
jgi:two-component system OmpR family sensor kinase